LVQSLQQLGIARILIEQLLKHNARLEQELMQSTHREEQARRLAYRDALTGLPNRTLLQDRFSQATSQAKRHRKLVAMLLIDLDGFKSVNDKLGHGAGDKLLCAVGARLLDSIRVEDTACRYGGDEFVIMLPEIADASMAAAAAEKIRAQMSKPEFIDGYEVRLTASIGTALYPVDGKSHEQLIKHADDAMYRAKARSSGASIKALSARNPGDPTPAIGDRNKVHSIASGR
jgi:diguanylate cyclase (GGDEF)-like protein